MSATGRKQTLTTCYRGAKIEVTIHFNAIWDKVHVRVYFPTDWEDSDQVKWAQDYWTRTRNVQSALAYGFNHVAYVLDGISSWPAGLPDTSAPPPSLASHHIRKITRRTKPMFVDGRVQDYLDLKKEDL